MTGSSVRSGAQPRKIGVVVNPTAGKGRAAKVGKNVEKLFESQGYDVWDLSGHNADLALEHAQRAVASGLDALVVVGGDGMVSLGLQAVGDTSVPFGIVAVGTGNDFATSLGLPVHDSDAAVDALNTAMSAGEAGIRPTDAIRVTGLGLSHATIEDLNHNGTSVGEPEEHVRWVAGAVSAGIDAAINERANKMLRPRGSSRYVIAALRELAAYRAWHYKLTFEHVVIRQDDDGGKQWFGRVLDMPGMTDLGPEPDGDGHRLQWISPGALVTAANAPQIGGGIFVAPKASMDDGLMDIVLAGDVGRSGASVLFPQMLSGGKHIHSNAVRIVRAKALTIESADGAEKLPTCFGDGEHLGTTPLRAELRPHALKILVPPQNP